MFCRSPIHRAIIHFFAQAQRGAKVKIEIIKIEPNRLFTDLTRFPGAKMVGPHEFIMHGDELEIKTTMSIDGWLSASKIWNFTNYW